jgi:hypothetical protein
VGCVAAQPYQAHGELSLQDWKRIGAMNLRDERRTPQQRAADVSSAEPSTFCRQDAGSTLRLVESGHGMPIDFDNHITGLPSV